MKRRQFKKSSIIINILLIFIFFTSSSHAQSVELTLEDLCLLSSDVVKVEVTSIKSYWNNSKTRIFTNISIKILEKYKGNLNINEEITYRTIGGTIDGITTFVVGNPGYSLGERAILFFERVKVSEGNENFVVSGMSQGKFKIIKDKITNEDSVIREQSINPIKIRKEGEILNITEKNAIPLTNFIKYIKDFTENN